MNKKEKAHNPAEKKTRVRPEKRKGKRTSFETDKSPDRINRHNLLRLAEWMDGQADDLTVAEEVYRNLSTRPEILDALERAFPTGETVRNGGSKWNE